VLDCGTVHGWVSGRQVIAVGGVYVMGKYHRIVKNLSAASYLNTKITLSDYFE